jgi:hypothetical protein
MSGTIVIITPTGITGEQRSEKRGQPPLEVLQRAVGGYIELVKVRWRGRVRDAFVNEDGISLQLRVNETACDLTINGHIIYGDMAIWVPDPAGQAARKVARCPEQEDS